MMWRFAVLLVAVAGHETLEQEALKLSPEQLAEFRAIQEGKVPKSKVEVVLAQYDEDVAWSDAYKNIRTVYCKKGSVGAEGCIPLENVGREGHTYLHHIVKNYDNLAEWTVFTQAGAPTVGYKGHRLGGGHMMPGMSFHDYVLKRDQPDGGLFVFTARMHVPTLAHSLRNNYVSATQSDSGAALTCPKEESGDSWEPWWDMGWFKEFLGSRCGVSATQMGETFADFWDQHVKTERPESDVVFFTQGARFAASKARIHQRPKEFYEDLLRLVSWEQDPCANYFNEWSWYYIIGKPEAAPCSMTEAERPPAHAAGRTLLAELPMSGTSGGCSAAEAAPTGPCSGTVQGDIPNGATQFVIQVPSGCAVGGTLIVCNQEVTLTDATRRLEDYGLKRGRRLTATNHTVNANPAITGPIGDGSPIASASGTTSTTTTDMSWGVPWWFWLLMYCLCCLCLAMCGVIPLPFMTGGKKKPVAKPMATPSVVEEVVTVEDEEPLVPMATAMVPTTVMKPTMTSAAVPMASMAVPATAGYGMASGAGYSAVPGASTVAGYGSGLATGATGYATSGYNAATSYPAAY